jgi:hypothetical protein
MRQSGELPIPPAALSDGRAIELARIWAAGGKQHVSLATGLWNDPSAWGIMLVDLARHLAHAYRQTQGLNPSEVLERIKAGFDAEWSAATDKPQGGLLE